VTAVGLATMVIADGDEVEVNGTTGTVTVLKQGMLKQAVLNPGAGQG